MERALNGTKMGGSKLVANLARFAKENINIIGSKKVEDVGKGKEKVFPVQEKVIHKNSFFSHGNGKLFSDLFSDVKDATVKNSSPTLNRGVNIEISDETVAFKDLIGIALVGRCKDLKTLRNLDTILVEGKIVWVSLTYMGGLSMLLKFDNEERCSKFLLDHHSWKDWFFSLDPWNCQSLPFERLAWVRILGVPMHLADNDVLNNIAEHFGKIVHGSQMEAEDDNFSASWIGLLVGEGDRIHDHVTLKWRDKQFRVWIEENIVDWTPDSVGKVDEMDEGECSSGKSGSGDDIHVVDPAMVRLESQKVAEVHERSNNFNAAKKVVNNILEANENSFGIGGFDSPSKVAGEQLLSPGGTQFPNAGNNSYHNDLFFFNSVDHLKRPKKRLSFKPRNKTQIKSGLSRSNSGERPKKRVRDNGEFNFDLNVGLSDNNYGHSQGEVIKEKKAPDQLDLANEQVQMDFHPEARRRNNVGDDCSVMKK
ncbi:hypothetical protein HanOQP8_Chr06g0220511 [Helianthus annuus]|nr:hypothetical protein HanLR1_Chr06g0211961 [Helianthus annuus]KAJ0740773.1 hypothetical protein HanOQP8_Chr06g0220511 [Helianthus annuus]KAJ0915412.1 hypothetical protein HanPSC8_Chr06g0249571 [Helianthus annuus]